MIDANEIRSMCAYLAHFTVFLFIFILWFGIPIGLIWALVYWYTN